MVERASTSTRTPASMRRHTVTFSSHTVRGKQPGPFGTEPIQHGAPVDSTIPAPADLVPAHHVGGGGNVRRVGQNKVEALACYWFEEVAAMHRALNTVDPAVDPGGRDRAHRKVDRGNRGGTGPGGGQRKGASTRADIQHAASRRVTPSGHDVDQQGGITVGSIDPWRS
jgi:hypothetical protein